jgi:hypothetical protein
MRAGPSKQRAWILIFMVLISMVCAPQTISCGRHRVHAPTFSVILNLFQDLLAIGISRE